MQEFWKLIYHKNGYHLIVLRSDYYQIQLNKSSILWKHMLTTEVAQNFVFT